MDYSENIINLNCSVYYISHRQETSGILSVYSTSKTGNRRVQVRTVEEPENTELPIERQNTRAEPTRVAEPQRKISEFSERDTVVKITSPTGYSGRSEQIVEVDRQVGSQNDTASILKEVEPERTILGLTQKCHVEEGVSSSAVKFVEETSKAVNHSNQEEAVDARVVFGLIEKDNMKISDPSECLSTSATSTRVDYQINRMEKTQTFASPGKGNRLTEKAFVNAVQAKEYVAPVMTVETNKADNKNQILKSVDGVQSSSETLERTECTYVGKANTLVRSVSRSVVSIVDVAAKSGRQSRQTGTVKEAEHPCEGSKPIEKGRAEHSIVDNKACKQNEQAEIQHKVQRVSKVSSTTGNAQKVNTASVYVENEVYEAMDQAGTVGRVQFAGELADYERDFLAKLATIDIATSRFVEKYFVSFRKFGPPLEISEFIEDDFMEEIPLAAVGKGKAAEIVDSSTEAAPDIHTARPRAKNVAALRKPSSQNGPDGPVKAVEDTSKIKSQNIKRPRDEDAESVEHDSKKLRAEDSKPRTPSSLEISGVVNTMSKPPVSEHMENDALEDAPNNRETLKPYAKEFVDAASKTENSYQKANLDTKQCNIESANTSQQASKELGSCMHKKEKPIASKQKIGANSCERNQHASFLAKPYDAPLPARGASSFRQNKSNATTDDLVSVRSSPETVFTKPASSCAKNIMKSTKPKSIEDKSSSARMTTASVPAHIGELKTVAGKSGMEEKEASSCAKNTMKSAKAKSIEHKSSSAHIVAFKTIAQTSGMVKKKGSSCAKNLIKSAKNTSIEDKSSSARMPTATGTSGLIKKETHSPCKPVRNCMPTHIAIQIEQYKQLPLEMITRQHIKQMKRWHKQMETRNNVLNTQEIKKLGTNRSHGKDDSSGHVSQNPQVPGVPFIPEFILDKLETLRQLSSDMITEDQRKAMDKWQKLVDTKNRLENLHMERLQQIRSQSIKRPHAEDSESMKHVSKKSRTEVNTSLRRTSVDITGVVDGISKPSVSNHPKICAMADIQKNLNRLKRYAKPSKNQKRIMKKLQKLVDDSFTMQKPHQKSKFGQEQTKIKSGSISEQPFRELSASQSKMSVSTVIKSNSINNCGGNSYSSVPAKSASSTLPAESYSHVSSVNAAGPLQKLNSCTENMPKPTEETSTDDASTPVGTLALSVPAMPVDTYPQLNSIIEGGRHQKLSNCIENVSKPVEGTSAEDTSSPVETSVACVSSKPAETYFQAGSSKAVGPPQELSSCIAAECTSTEGASCKGLSVSVSAKATDIYTQLGVTTAVQPLQELIDIDHTSKPTEGAGSSVETSSICVSAKLEDPYSQPGVAKPTEDTLIEDASTSIRTSAESVSMKSADTNSQVSFVKAIGPVQEPINCIENISKPIKDTSSADETSSIGMLTTSVPDEPTCIYAHFNPLIVTESFRDLDSCVEDLSKSVEDASYCASAAPSFSELAAEHGQFRFVKEIEPLQGVTGCIENISTAAQNKFDDKIAMCVDAWPTCIEKDSVDPARPLQEVTISRENISKLAECKLKMPSTSEGMSVVPVSGEHPNTLSQLSFEEAARQLQAAISSADAVNSTNAKPMPSTSERMSVVPVSGEPPNTLSQLSFEEAARQLQAVISSTEAVNSTNAKPKDDAEKSEEMPISAKKSAVSDEMVKTAVPLREVSTCVENVSKYVMSKSAEATSSSGTKLIKKIPATAARKAPTTNVDERDSEQLHDQKENQGRKRRHDADNDGPGNIKRQRTKAPLCSFRVAVVDKEYPEVILTRDQSDAIENELADRLEKAAAFGELVPLQFSNCSYAGGVLWICCENERTKGWLKRNVERLTSFWKGIRLKAVDEADLPLRPKVMVFVPDQEPDAREFRACLDRENPGLTASNWLLIGKKSEDNGGVIFAFSIDTNSYAMFENNDWKVSYKRTTIRCKVMNKISDMWEDTSESHNAASSSGTLKLKGNRERKGKGYPISWRNAHLKQTRKNQRYGNFRSSSQSVYVPYIGFLKF